mmetsp:Transcript_6543/g.10193  ORF Transcript_6543/g.10193 Transcript_6543/m.10193 type:complete len:132 (-) Transcript_6543:164-559(-)
MMELPYYHDEQFCEQHTTTTTTNKTRTSRFRPQFLWNNFHHQRNDGVDNNIKNKNKVKQYNRPRTSSVGSSTISTTRRTTTVRTSSNVSTMMATTAAMNANISTTMSTNNTTIGGMTSNFGSFCNLNVVSN